MDYQKHYDSLIASRRNRVLNPTQYYEKHHIVMKSMGGTDDSENIVTLTAREHFLAHWLLWRIHRNRSTAFAFHRMCKGSEYNRDGIKFSSIAYAEARENFKEKVSELFTGKKKNLTIEQREKLAQHRAEMNRKLNTGKPLSDTQKRKISISNKGKHFGKRGPHTEEAKEKIGKYWKGRKRSPETIEKMKIAQQNRKPLTEESRKKMSDSAKMRKRTAVSEETKRKISERAKLRWAKIKNFVTL